MTSPSPAPPLPAPSAPSAPLVAPREDTTRATSGVALVETGDALHDAIASGSWRDGALAGLGFGIELAAAALDPLGALAAAGVGWLMEHVRPLSDLLDRLTGDPDAVAAQARTWRNVAAAVRAAGEEMGRAAAPGDDWAGDAADAYTRAATARAEEIRASGVVADALGAAVAGAGSLVSLVREVVRELIAQLVATLVVRVPQWALEEVGSLGLATPHVVASAVAVIAKVTTRVVRLAEGLVRSLHRLGDLVGELLDLARRLFARAPAAPPAAPTVPARVTPASASPRTAADAAAPARASDLPAHPFGPGTGSPPTGPATGPPLPAPSARVPAPRPEPPLPPEQRAALAQRIRAALEPEPPTRPAAAPAPRQAPTRPPTAAERAAHEQHLDRLVEKYPERYDGFRYNDPDHRNKSGRNQIKEARIGLDMIDSKRWSPATRRPTDHGDFIDPVADQRWDIKGFHSDYPDATPTERRVYPFKEAVTADDVAASLANAFGKDPDVKILLDIRMVDSDALDSMKSVVREKGWSDRVEWYP